MSGVPECQHSNYGYRCSASAYRDEIEQLRVKLAEAEQRQISGFYEEVVPSFQQGAPHHELQGLVTAEEVTGYVQTLSKALADRDSLRADNYALRKDAVRYRWLKEKAPWTIKTIAWERGGDAVNHNEPDAAIDAARGAEA